MAKAKVVINLASGLAAQSGREVAGATPLWEWIGDEAATVFSY